MLQFKLFQISKRQKFALTTILLFVGIILIRQPFVDFLSWRIRVVVFSLVTIIATTLALHDEDYSGVEWFMLPTLPSFFAISSALIFPLLPERLDFFWGISLRPDTSLIVSLFLKMTFLAIFSIGFYATLLTSNIFNVSAVRSIQLIRVARSIGFLVTVTTALFFYIVVSSLHLSSFLNFVAIFALTFSLALQSIWSINLESKIGEEVRNFSFLTALILAEVAWALSFWPVSVSIFALFLTAIFYEIVGIVQYHLEGKLSLRVANEFILVAVAVFLLTIFTTAWGA